jgi:hypothetical protein
MEKQINSPALRIPQLFSLEGKTAIVTGGTGLRVCLNFPNIRI